MKEDSCLNVYIAEDESIILMNFKMILQRLGYHVAGSAVKGDRALDEILELRPDLLLLDINMPGMDGIEVCRRIRDRVSCPIIFLTAKVEEQDRVMGLLSGGDDYVLKPFSLKELDARIIAHLKRGF